jgi:hypothetical protein
MATFKQAINPFIYLSRYTNDIALAKNAATFNILADGIPIIYAGQEQHYAGGSDPANREATWLSGYSTSSELYRLIATMNALRNHAITQDPGYLTYKVGTNFLSPPLPLHTRRIKKYTQT